MEAMVSQSSRLPRPAFWQGRRVLLTGHTGFKGGWLALWLQQMGAQVKGLALAPDSTPNLFQAADIAGRIASELLDIRDASAVQRAIQEWQPEVVLHLAAQALVRPAYQDPVQTYATNLMGSVHVLEAIRHTPSVRAVVMVTTDKVYKNLERRLAYPETAELGGHDPYSASKAASELVIASYRQAFLAAQDVRVGVARAGNVIGGGDWSADRLLPDAVRAWQAGACLQIRRPQAVRPWQHVLEPVSAYLCLAEAMYEQAGYARAWNFGPDSAETVEQVVKLAQSVYGGAVEFGDGLQGPHEAGLLALDAGQARRELGIFPRWSLQQAVTRTMLWYRAFADGGDAADLCLQQIEAFCQTPAAAASE